MKKKDKSSEFELSLRGIGSRQILDANVKEAMKELKKCKNNSNKIVNESKN